MVSYFIVHNTQSTSKYKLLLALLLLLSEYLVLNLRFFLSTLFILNNNNLFTLFILVFWVVLDSMTSVTESSPDKGTYTCGRCGRTYSHAKSFYIHCRYDCGIAKLNCPYCDYSSTRRHNMKRHLLMTHPNSSIDLIVYK